MTIAITIKNTNGPEDSRKALVFTVAETEDGNELSTPVAELGGGEEITSYIHNSQRIEIMES